MEKVTEKYNRNTIMARKKANGAHKQNIKFVHDKHFDRKIEV